MAWYLLLTVGTAFAYGVVALWFTVLSPAEQLNRIVASNLTTKQRKVIAMKILDVPQSGSVGGVTSSRNRFGQYRRTKAMPVNPSTSAQNTARARLAANAAGWRALTSAQRSGWNDLALSMTRQDSLGQTITLTGAQAYSSVNNNNLAAGNAIVSAAPALLTPSAMLTCVPTLTAAAFTLAVTPTPLPAGAKCLIYVSPMRSAGRAFESDFRLLQVTAAAAASPYDIYAAYVAKFGVPITGQRIFIKLRCYTGGFLSGQLVTSAVVA